MDQWGSKAQSEHPQLLEMLVPPSTRPRTRGTALRTW